MSNIKGLFSVMAALVAAVSISACDDGGGQEDSDGVDGYQFFDDKGAPLNMSKVLVEDGLDLTVRDLEADFDAGLYLYNQTSPFTDRVVAYMAIATAPALLVIHEYVDDEVGKVLGMTEVPWGISENVEVGLSRDFEHKERLYAVLYEDLGELGVFEPGVDEVFLNYWGYETVRPFTTHTHTPVSEFLWPGNQLVSPGEQKVSISTVASDEEGWVAVYDDDSGAPGMLLGYAAVPHEYSVDVEVSLQRDLLDGEQLWAVLHDDLGGIGIWEPGVDVKAEEPCPGTTSVPFTVTVQ